MIAGLEAFTTSYADNYDNGYIVPARSRKGIRSVASSVRKQCDVDELSPFPIMNFLEMTLPRYFKDFTLRIATPKTLEGANALTTPSRNTIILNEDIYDAACNDEGHGRLTVAHEIGHLLLHRNIKCEELVNEKTEKYKNSEWQASAFAGELLMPAECISTMEPEEISQRYLVSRKAAEYQKRVCSR